MTNVKRDDLECKMNSVRKYIKPRDIHSSFRLLLAES